MLVRLRQAEPSAHIRVDMYTVFVVTKALEIFRALADQLGTIGGINALAWSIWLISRMMIKQDPAKALAKISDGFVNESLGLKQAGAAVLCFDNIWSTESIMASTIRRKCDAYYN